MPRKRRPKALGTFKVSDVARVRLENLERDRMEHEARYWVEWVQSNGHIAWQDKRNALTRRRGKESVERLVAEMTVQREQARVAKRRRQRSRG